MNARPHLVFPWRVHTHTPNNLSTNVLWRIDTTMCVAATHDFEVLRTLSQNSGRTTTARFCDSGRFWGMGMPAWSKQESVSIISHQSSLPPPKHCGQCCHCLTWKEFVGDGLVHSVLPEWEHLVWTNDTPLYHGISVSRQGDGEVGKGKARQGGLDMVDGFLTTHDNDAQQQ